MACSSDRPDLSTSQRPPGQGPIRSFVRREGRITPAQKRALTRLWPEFGLDFTGQSLDPGALFGRRAPNHVEIGCGTGDTLLALAHAHPENNYLGIEVHRPGVGHLLAQLKARGIDNVRILCADAVAVLAHLPGGCLDGIHIYFPDPWPKKRHHKRRLLQAPFLEILASRLAPQGRVFLATDWQDYAEHILACLQEQTGLINLAGAGRYAPRPLWRPPSRYERRALRLGHEVRNFILARAA